MQILISAVREFLTHRREHRSRFGTTGFKFALLRNFAVVMPLFLGYVSTAHAVQICAPGLVWQQTSPVVFQSYDNKVDPPRGAPPYATDTDEFWPGGTMRPMQISHVCPLHLGGARLKDFPGTLTRVSTRKIGPATTGEIAIEGRYTGLFMRQLACVDPTPYGTSTAAEFRATGMCIAPPPLGAASYFVVTPKSADVSKADSGCPPVGSQPAPRVGHHVNPSNGAECHVETDIVATAPGLSLGFTRYYNSLNTEGGTFGAGWTHSFSRRIVPDEPVQWHLPGDPRYSATYGDQATACTDGWLEVRDVAGQPDTEATYSNGECLISRDGRETMRLPIYNTYGYLTASTRVNVIRDSGHILHFDLRGTTYVAEPGIPDELYAHGSGGYRYVDANGNTEIYDSSGRLQSVADRAGKTLTVTYPPGKMEVANNFGHRLDVFFAGGRVLKVRHPDGSETGYLYDNDLRLSWTNHPDGQHRRYTYTDPQWSTGLSSVVDETNTTLHTWDYDNQGRVVFEQLAGGADALTLSYNLDGTTTVTDALGASRTYTYEQIGGHMRNSAITGDPCDDCGHPRSRTYDAAGYPTSSTDDRGHVTHYSYDSERGVELSRTEAVGTAQQRTITTLYHNTFRLPRQIDEPGRRITFTYDSKGNLLTRAVHDIAAAITRTWTYTYNTNGQVLTARGPRNDVTDITQYQYNNCVTGYGCGQISQITNALNQVTLINSYDAAGRPLQITDPNGAVTTLTYHARGWLLSSTTAGETTTFDYYPTGKLQRITPPSGDWLEYVYDGAQRLTEIHDAHGARIVYTLDAKGNRTAQHVYDGSNTLRRSQTAIYDNLSRLREVHGAYGQLMAYTYDDAGNRITESRNGSTLATNEYDALDRLFRVTDAASGVTQFAYNSLDGLTSVTDPRSLVTSYSLSAFGDVSQLQSPDTGTSTATYDYGGNLKKRTDAKGQIVTYTYDALHRVTKAVYTGGPTINYSYDAGTYGKGRLTGITGPGANLSWTYTAQGRVASKTQVVGARTLVTSYSYDSAGRLATQTLPSGKVVGYSWTLNRLTGITLDGNPVASNLLHEPFGGVNQWDFANGQQVQKSFDLSGRMTDHSLGTLGYDTADRITGLSHGNLSQLTGSKTYGYDALDRLASYLGSSFNIGYSYDANGNRVQQTGTAGTTDYATSLTSNRLTSLTVSGITQNFSYDANGSLTTDGSHTYVYDKTGRLTSADSTSYAYNGLGQRVSKTASGGGTVYTYDEAGRMLGEYNASTGAAIQETIWMGDTPIAVVKGSGTYYVHADHLNTPRQISDQAGDPVWVWDTITFGGSTPDEDPLATGTPFVYNLRHPGQYFDAETGLLQNWNRDYNPSLGRYVESDPIGLAGGLNTFAYVEGNPLSYVDPSGLLTSVDFACARDPAFCAEIFGQLAQNAAAMSGDPCLEQEAAETADWLSNLGMAAEVATVGKAAVLGVIGAAKKPVSMGTVGDLRRSGQKDAHHTIQQAAVRDLPGYDPDAAPGVVLPGPSTAIGSPHYAATQAQRQAGGGTYAAERRIAYKALRQAGLSESQARNAIRAADRYFRSIGVGPSTVTRIPGNRK